MESNDQQANNQPVTMEVDDLKYQHFMQQEKDNENIPLGLLAGATAALAGAVIWALITYFTNYQIGLIAVVIGYMVGFAIRNTAKSFNKSISFAGAGLSLLGCVVGNLFVICAVISNQESIPFFDVLSKLDFDIAVELMIETFELFDLVFYGIAIYEGYRLSPRQLTDEEMAKLTRQN